MENIITVLHKVNVHLRERSRHISDLCWPEWDWPTGTGLYPYYNIRAHA